ncbi:MAG: zf-HC2 domain-containing protein [Proteobacteria bacterium]|nr:zf-HC2 domain-containing protein [Pseudomonadota bacterium]
MSCEAVRARLTAYLDGELEGDRGTVVRGHLRECAACRTISEQEATLRDGLRALPTLDPPPSLWAGVQAQLAAAEVAQSRQPGWRRAVARAQQWSRDNFTRLVVGGGAIAAFAGVTMYLRAHHEPDPNAAVSGTEPRAPVASLPPPTPAATTDRPPPDVAADIADEPRQVAGEYEVAANEVLALADAARPGWSDAQRTIYDTRLATLRAEIASAADVRGVQRGWRALIRFAQVSVAREPVAMIDGPGAP